MKAPTWRRRSLLASTKLDPFTSFEHVLQHLRGEHGDRLAYETLEPRGTAIGVAGVEVRLAALADIANSERFADRDKDYEALPELERLLRDAGE